MFDNGIQFARQPLFYQFRQRVTIALLCIAHGIFPQRHVRPLNGGRVQPFGDGPHIGVYHIGYFIRVFNYNLTRFCLGQVAELAQHIICVAEIQRRLVVCVLEAVTRLKYRTVYCILRVQKVYIARSHHHFVQLFTQAQHSFVEFLYLFNAVHHVLAHHVFVVAHRLNFQIVVIRGDGAQFFKAAAFHDGPIQFARLTRRTQNQPVPVFV